MSTNSKRYVGSVSMAGTVAVTRVDGSPLPPRYDLFKQASDGFAWGDGGPGAAQLAVALLADCLGDDDRALTWHRDFKSYVVARLPAERGWTLKEEYICRIVGELSHGVRNRPM